MWHLEHLFRMLSALLALQAGPSRSYLYALGACSLTKSVRLGPVNIPRLQLLLQFGATAYAKE
jgi:hypothetical protein